MADTPPETPPADLDGKIRNAVVSRTAARMRAYRARQASGLQVLSVEIDEVNVAEALVAEGFLHPQATDNRDNIKAALEAMLRQWALSYA
jgi:hypothetical protein